METSTFPTTAMIKIEVPSLQAKSVKIIIIDQSEFAGAGQVTNNGIAISGSGENWAGILEDQRATTKSGGHDRANIWVNDKLDLGITGFGNSFREAPKITQAIIGASSVSPMEQ